MDAAVIADDLTGALEAASAFLVRTSRIYVASTTSLSVDPTVRVAVVDTDSRHLSDHDASARVRSALSRFSNARMIVKKIDSLLRGNVSAELEAAQSVRRGLVFAPALPEAGRTVRSGVVHVDGRRLDDTDLWHSETGAPPTDIDACLEGLRTATIGLSTIEAGPVILARALLEATATGAIPVCDSISERHLDLVVEASLRAWKNPIVVGSSGIAAAVARRLPADDVAPADLDTTLRDWRRENHESELEGVFLVVGSAAPGVRRQLDTLTAGGATILAIAASDLLDPSSTDRLAARVAATSRDRVVAVCIEPDIAVPVESSRALVARLAAVVAPTAATKQTVVLTGGETARRVLDSLGIESLVPFGIVHHGAVVCGAPGGRVIVTRPGSFGGPDSLTSIIRNSSFEETKEST